jgi:beta-phosphoglucomutase family hydrolase
MWYAIFDWDGVIVDSSRLHEESWNLLAREEGRSLPSGHFQRSFGRTNESIIPTILGWSDDPDEIRRLSLRKEVLFRERVSAGGMKPLPGVRAWLETLRAAGIPCAIASSTHLENIRLALGLLGLEKHFQAVVSAEDVRRGKPDPEVFLIAARKLGGAPGRCVVFEDAHVGLDAARAAGMKVIGIATTHPAETLAGADLVVEDLERLKLDRVEGLLDAPESTPS